MAFDGAASSTKKRFTVTLDHPNLESLVRGYLEKGWRVRLYHQGSGSGPIADETIALVDGELWYRPEHEEENGWDFARMPLKRVVDGWLSRVKRGDNFVRGDRGGLGFYLVVNKTIKDPTLGSRW